MLATLTAADQQSGRLLQTLGVAQIMIEIGDGDCLIVVDVQNDFCPGGALPVPDGDKVIPAINRLTEIFPHYLLTQDWHPPGHLSFASSHPGSAPFQIISATYGAQTLWPDHCVQGSIGAQLHPLLQATRAELVLRKGFRADIDSYSAFRENDRTTKTGLAGYMRERGFERLFIAGFATDYCVRYSAEDARHAGFETLIIEDACRAIDLDGSLAEAQKALNRCGIRRIRAAAITR